MKIDMHVHSNHSDGTKSIEELIDLARKIKLDGFALTDHDTIEGYYEFLDKNIEYKVIPGIELSTYHKGKSVHILGYFPISLPNLTEFRKYLNEVKEKRDIRNLKIIDNLKKYYNLELDYQEIKANAHGVIARPHLARVICQKYGYDFEEVFDKFLGDDSPAYVEISRLSTKDGIKMLKDNSAFVVLAHPMFLNDEIVSDILKMGLDGIEVDYATQDRKKYARLAREYNLLNTGGSDYHGEILDSKLGSHLIKENDLKKLENILF